MNIKDITKASFKEQYEADSNAVLLDVRTPMEIADGNIEGHEAIDFFAPDFQEQIDQLDKSKNYYIYCRSGNRSLQTCYLMHQKGFTGKLVNLAGGYMMW
jgi:rhodanese-related sulfurtransferase